MTAWLIGIITVIVVLFVLWRSRSREFRARAEYPKYRFLENLGFRHHEPHSHDSLHTPKENKNGQNHS